MGLATFEDDDKALLEAEDEAIRNAERAADVEPPSGTSLQRLIQEAIDGPRVHPGAEGPGA